MENIERLRPKSEQEEARLHEWMDILCEAQIISREKSAGELIELLDKKIKGEISDEDLERKCFTLGEKSMADALKEVLEKRGK